MKPTYKPFIADVTDVTPADLLRGAVCYLQLHGWHQGALYTDSSATTGTPEFTPAACALGAIGMAAFGQRIPTDAMEPKYSAQWRDYQRASNFLSDYLTLTGAIWVPDEDTEDWDGPSVGDWNDQDGRTLADVLAALLAAADEFDRAHAPLPVLNLPGGENA